MDRPAKWLRYRVIGGLVACLLLAACQAPEPPAPGTPGLDVTTPLPSFAPPSATVPPPAAPTSTVLEAVATATSAPVAPSPTAAPGVAPTADTRLPQLVLTNQQGQRNVVYVEIADTPEKQETGLMRRTTMAEDQGMIFVFAGEVTIPFWMKDTLLPLSIAFIRADGQIVDLQNMQPQDLSLHTPAAPYTYALEVNQGYFVRHNLAIGDRVDLAAIPTPTVAPTVTVLPTPTVLIATP